MIVDSINNVNLAGSTESHSYPEGSTNSTSALQSTAEVDEFSDSTPGQLTNTREIQCSSAAGLNQQSRSE